MNGTFVSGQARGHLPSRIRIRYSRNGEPFVLFDLIDFQASRATVHKCVAVGTVAETLAAMTISGELLELHGVIGPFARILPTGKEVRIDRALKVSHFQFLDEDAVPVLPNPA